MFRDLKERGIQAPLLMIGDEGKGLWKGVDGVFPGCEHQHCWFHKSEDVRSELPKQLHPMALGMLREIWKQPTRAAAEKAAAAFGKKFSDKYPKAVLTVSRNLDSLLRYYDYPSQHWIHLRTSNPIENVFSPVRAKSNRMRGMAGRSTLLTMTYMLAVITCRHSRAVNGTAQLLELCRGAKFRDGEKVDSD
jgi:transposase-like protein